MIDAIASCIEELEANIIELESNPNPNRTREVLGSLGVSNMRIASAQVIALLDMLTDGITPVNKDIISALLLVCESQKRFLYSMAGIVEDQTEAIKKRREEEAALAAEQAAEQAAKSEAEPEPEELHEEHHEEAEAPDKASPTVPKTQTISSVRVDTDRLDSLIELVGKLTVTYAVIAQAGMDSWAKVSASLRELDGVITQLQSEVDAIRLVPLKQIFMPMHRLVKSLSQKIGKKVRFEVLGETLHLDKTIVESLNEPLVHLLRNAVDHGLEDTEGRQAAGKDETGVVTLEAWRKGETAYIAVRDDGRGMDPDAIRAKAREKGLLGEDEEVSDKEALQFVLKSGFSTAKAVTDVSGRGVGMDAVVTVIRNSLDGDLAIESEPGKGSSFTLDIPLARSANQGIVDALVCKLNSDVFLIPSQDVVEIYLPKDQDLVELPDGRHTVDVRGRIYGLVPLAKVLGMECGGANITDCQVVVVRVGDSRAAILVDEVLRQQQVVITKFTVPVEELFHLPILGFGMMGESDALVVDTESLLQEVKGVAEAGA